MHFIRRAPLSNNRNSLGTAQGISRCPTGEEIGYGTLLKEEDAIPVVARLRRLQPFITANIREHSPRRACAISYETDKADTPPAHARWAANLANFQGIGVTGRSIRTALSPSATARAGEGT
jgi:hypothetical protein